MNNHPTQTHLHALSLPGQVGLVVLSQAQRLAVAAHHRARVAAVRRIQLVACGRGGPPCIDDQAWLLQGRHLTLHVRELLSAAEARMA